MEYYEALCIIEECENLNFLKHCNIKPNNKYISLQKKDNASLVIQKKGLPFEHFPECHTSKKVDYHQWRRLNNYPEIVSSIMKNSINFDMIKMMPVKKIDIDVFHSFINKKIGKINKKLLLNIKFENCENDKFRCVELPFSKKSIVLLGKRKKHFSIEETIYFFHKVGHAIYNSFKYYNNFYVPIELDEIFAHLFEFYFYYKYYYSTIDESEELAIYKKILNKKLTNNIVYTEFACQIYKKKFNDAEKQSLLNKIALKYGIDIDIVKKTNWKEIPEIFSYPFYPASYVFIQSTIINFISHSKVRIDFSKFDANILNIIYVLSKSWTDVNWSSQINKLFVNN